MSVKTGTRGQKDAITPMNDLYKFRVALTADFYEASGRTKYRDIGLSLFDGCDRIAVSRFADHRAEIEPDQLAGANGVIVLTPRVTARSLSASNDLLAIGRFGVDRRDTGA